MCGLIGVGVGIGDRGTLEGTAVLMLEVVLVLVLLLLVLLLLFKAVTAPATAPFPRPTVSARIPRALHGSNACESRASKKPRLRAAGRGRLGRTAVESDGRTNSTAVGGDICA